MHLKNLAFLIFFCQVKIHEQIFNQTKHRSMDLLIYRSYLFCMSPFFCLFSLLKWSKDFQLHKFETFWSMDLYWDSSHLQRRVWICIDMYFHGSQAWNFILTFHCELWLCYSMETITLGDKRIAIKTSVLEEKATACNMLCCYADELKEGFFPWIDQVFPMKQKHCLFYWIFPAIW